MNASFGCFTKTIKKNQCNTNVYIGGIAVLCYGINTTYKTLIDQSESMNQGHHFRVTDIMINLHCSPKSEKMASSVALILRVVPFLRVYSSDVSVLNTPAKNSKFLFINSESKI